MPAGDYGANLLALEGEVRRDGQRGHEGAETVGELEPENRKLKHVVAELTLDNRALKDVLSKNWQRLRNFGPP